MGRVQCDYRIRHKKIGSIIPKNKQEKIGPFVKARFALTGNYSSQTQVLRAEIRDIMDDGIFKQFLNTASTRTSGRATEASRLQAKKFKRYVKSLQRLAGEKSESCTFCSENFAEESDVFTFFVKNTNRPCQEGLHQIHRKYHSD